MNPITERVSQAMLQAPELLIAASLCEFLAMAQCGLGFLRDSPVAWLGIESLSITSARTMRPVRSMKLQPTTSGSSHLFEGVFLGVSQAN
jgi:hypothetical protein